MSASIHRSSTGSRDAKEEGAFPVQTVTILVLCLTLNNYTLVSLFPYIGVMVMHLLGLETTNEAGFYTGYVASAITLGRFMSAYPLGHVTDSVGRKPVIIGGLLSMAVFSVTFGLSTTFTFAIASRLVLGLTNGISPALRTTLREVCGHEHVLQGMTYFSGCQAFSLVFGTGIGGLLAQPAVNYPRVFSDTGFFGEYPFLLPNLVGAFFALALVPLVVIYVPETKEFEAQGVRQELSSDTRSTTSEHVPEETLDNGVTRGAVSIGAGRRWSAYQLMNGNGREEELSQHDAGGREELSQQGADDEWGAPQHGRAGLLFLEVEDIDDSEVASRIPRSDGSSGRELVPNGEEEDDYIGEEGGASELLRTPHVKTVLFLGCAVQALLIGFEEAWPLWALSTPDVGGLSWGTIKIGKVFLAAGLIVAMLQFFVFPRVVKVLGITAWQRIGCLVGIPAFLAASCAQTLSWNGASLFVVSMASIALIYCCNAMVTLTLVIASTSMVQASMRGKLGGLYYATESLGRFLGPVGFASTFAWSISPSAFDWVDHHLIFFMSAIAMALIAILAWGTITDENVLIQVKKREVAADTPATHIGDSDHGVVDPSGEVTRSFVQPAVATPATPVSNSENGVVLSFLSMPCPGGGADLV